ncbi:hypothetical protein BDP27DRAFT_1448905 [Rhodocollybia butyracea]|uniref:Uncharacterized protein n=1 Tax=Rhodocollybia butyracea TaxID=206335 RepID=A0A9P5PTD0_9AGAR|nr:hypothetical protein BDP27DRAFT_1448905 [Rhodocollybia butyracea]
MANPGPKYPHDVPSLQSLYPTLQNIPNHPELNRSVTRGAVLDISHLHDAKKAIATLEVFLDSSHPNVTPSIVESSKLRYAALQNIHATPQYGTGDSLFDELRGEIDNLNNRIDGLVESTSILQAEAANRHNRVANGKVGFVLVHRMQKIAPGTGGNLVQQVRPASNYQIPSHAAPAIGTVMKYNIARICDMNHHDILRAIYHYNEDFGIVQGDDLTRRQKKFAAWHVT